MKHLLIFTVLLVVGLLGLGFATLNGEAVEVNFYLTSIKTPVALLVVMSLFAGAVLGVVASLGLLLAQKRETHRLRRRNSMVEKELQNLRELPIKDTR